MTGLPPAVAAAVWTAPLGSIAEYTSLPPGPSRRMPAIIGSLAMRGLYSPCRSFLATALRKVTHSAMVTLRLLIAKVRSTRPSPVAGSAGLLGLPMFAISKPTSSAAATTFEARIAAMHEGMCKVLLRMGRGRSGTCGRSCGEGARWRHFRHP